MNDLYPILFQLAGRRVVFVGGGSVAARRIPGLLQAQAKVRVISPSLDDSLLSSSREGHIDWLTRPYASGDLDGAALVFVAVDDPALSEQISQDARKAGIPASIANDAQRGDFHVPASGTASGVQIAVGTRGASPTLAARIRDRVLSWLRQDRGRWDERSLEQVAAERAESSTAERRAHADRISAATEENSEAKRVSLVGAGPGSADLLTLRGFDLLRRADVVYYDRLVGSGILEVIPGSVEQIYVGKEVGCARRANIVDLMIEAARAGRRVVRLKGGDPYLFGRGGEETLELARAGVPFEVVPGVSALCSVPGATGIPVTCRGVSDELIVRSGHGMKVRDDQTDTALTYDRNSTGTTYVYFMAVARLRAVVQELVDEGVATDTPVAVVASGTQANEKIVEGPLGSIADIVDTSDMRPPALIIVGNVVRFRDLDRAIEELGSVVLEDRNAGGGDPKNDAAQQLADTNLARLQREPGNI